MIILSPICNNIMHVSYALTCRSLCN